MVVLINAYSGVLTSLLTIPKLNPIANTMKEVTESKELRVTVEKNLPMSKKFLVYSYLNCYFKLHEAICE